MVPRTNSDGIEFYIPFDAIGVSADDANTVMLSAAKQWFSNNSVQIVYPLATPQTYQLTPTEVRTLLGGNTIYTDAGTIEALTYVAEIYEED
jgi:hypothetical protein